MQAYAASEGNRCGVAADKALGVATELAVLGPFRDTGGGLLRKEGPEASVPNGPERWSSGPARLRRPERSLFLGHRRRRLRAVPPPYAQSSGFPLDVFVSPRKESCSLVATSIELEAARAIVVRLASTGQARLMFDGAEIGHSEDVFASASFDRLAGQVEASAGSHLVWAKVCSGALDDRGSVRLRFTDPEGAPLVLQTHGEPFLAPAASSASAKVRVLETPLARAIGPHHDGSNDALLDLSILRTLGGSDDLRSPRAPASSTSWRVRRPRRAMPTVWR